MANRSLTPQTRAIHKRFFPANILILCIALIAAFFQLFTPVFDVRIHVTKENLSPLLQTSAGEGSSAEMMELALSDVDFVLPIKIAPTPLLKAATGSEEDVKSFFNSVLGDAELLEEVLEQIAPSILSTGIAAMLSTEGISAEDMEKYKAPSSEVLELLSAGKEEEARGKFHSMAQQIATDKGKTLTEQEIEDYFNKIKDAGTTESGAFKSSELLKNLDGDLLSGKTESESTEPATEPTASTGEQARATLTAEDSEAAKSSSPLATIIEFLENPGEKIVKLFTGSNMGSLATLQKGLLAIYFVLVGLPALFWLLLAVFAVLRLFTAYKRVRYGYVYVFCMWQGLLILLANVGLKAMSKAIGGEGAALLSSFGLKVLGSGIVTGCCCLALIVLSVVWYGPIKRKLKKAARGELTFEEAYDEEMEIDE